MPPEPLVQWVAFSLGGLGLGTGLAALGGRVLRGVIRSEVQPALAAQAEQHRELVRRFDHQLGVNGHEDEGHPDDRGLPLRSLVLRTARHARRTDESLATGSAWMRRHDIEHVRRDADWPVGGRGSG